MKLELIILACLFLFSCSEEITYKLENITKYDRINTTITRTESGYTITSYSDPQEKFYDGEQIEVFSKNGSSLGFFKKDFLEQVKIDGSGVLEGEDTRFLHYDFSVDDNITYYLADYSLGAWDNKLNNWTQEKPSIAIKPPLEHDTKIRIRSVGPNDNPAWVNDLLLSKTFYVDDKFYGVGNEKRIDIYVGLQKSKTTIGRPESLLIHNVTIKIIE